MSNSLLLRLAKQWIAGETADRGIARVKEANAKGILGLLNLLGEHIESREEIQKTIEEYTTLLDLIDEARASSQISIKPTQMGINLDVDYCVSNYQKIASHCALHHQNWLWIDMENSPYTQTTLDVYVKVLQAHSNTGLAIQAYMRRSEKDLENLLPLGGKVRLVKGAYNEAQNLVYKSKDEIRSNYAKLMEMLFSSKRQEENFFAVATHDSKLIELAKELAKKYDNRHFEFEMLMGVRDNLKKELVAQGYQVREYIPYGPQWLPYSIRRIKEKKSNIFLLGRSLFSG